MEILITSTTITVYSDEGLSLGTWPIAEASAALLWSLVEATRDGNAARVLELYATAGTSSR
jgi:hypothetical protein